MNPSDILEILNQNYALHFHTLEFVRESGSVAYAAFTDCAKYFLRITKPAFYDTVSSSLDIHMFLQRKGFSVPSIIFTKKGAPCVCANNANEKRLYILYEYIDGNEVDPEQDTEAIGALIGQFHNLMKSYPGTLVNRDKHFYTGRYIDFMRKKQYPKTDEFAAYGEVLWKKVKDFPRGYCHGDMYRGNILKASDGRLFILDFDTSCHGFPMYDVVLICNMTDYFHFQEDGYLSSRKVLERFLPEYLKYNKLSQEECDSFCDFIALYHFALQATIIEVFGMDCVDHAFLDQQLHWLKRWRDQYTQNTHKA